MIAGCRPGAEGPSAASSPGASPTPAAGASLQAPAAQTFGPVDPCPTAPPDPRLPSGAGCLTVAEADLDADRKRDLVLLFAKLGAGGRPEGWQARAVLASGAVADLDLGTTGVNARLAAQGVADADGDGGDEVFPVLEAGASTEFLGILALDRGRLVEVEAVQGARREPLRLGLGGSVTHGDGFECTTGAPPALLVRSVAGGDGDYRWREDRYRWERKSVVLESSQSGTLPAGHPELGRFYRAQCGPLVIR